MRKSRAQPADQVSACNLHTGSKLPAAHVDIECRACGAAVPASTATALEGMDYLWHFCGNDCLVDWCGRIEQTVREAADRGSIEDRIPVESGRIRFLLRRDGLVATLAWVASTMRIYRAAVLDPDHHASSALYRRGYIASYCDFKRWLAHVHACDACARR